MNTDNFVVNDKGIMEWDSFLSFKRWKDKKYGGLICVNGNS